MTTLSLLCAGGARHVTGSQFLFEAVHEGVSTRILVDCGLTQGMRFCESSNNDDFQFDPASLDAVFVTHAHTDHIGLLPKLVRDGCQAPVYATAATISLMAPMLEDSASLIAREAASCDETPPYGPPDIAHLINLARPVQYRAPTVVAPGITVTLFNAGHIIGSALVLIEAFGTRILFTGDLGRTPAILVPDLDMPPGPIHYLITESVYGNRAHTPAENAERVLEQAVVRAKEKNGTLLIPSFSLERTQIILTVLDRMAEKGMRIPVFLDSPLAARVTDVYRAHPEFLRDTIRDLLRQGNDPFSFPTLSVTQHPRDRAIDRVAGAKIIIAGAGMSHGGRIRGHEKEYLPDPSTTLVLVGYQVPGSIGRRLKDGAREVIIDKKRVPVRAHIMETGGFSAHADRDELLQFAINAAPEAVFVVLGELEAAAFLAQRIGGTLGITPVIPQKGERLQLVVGGPGRSR